MMGIFVTPQPTADSVVKGDFNEIYLLFTVGGPTPSLNRLCPFSSSLDCATLGNSITLPQSVGPISFLPYPRDEHLVLLTQSTSSGRQFKGLDFLEASPEVWASEMSCPSAP